MSTPTILLVGTFDTKPAELKYVRTAIETLGASVIALDSSVGGASSDHVADISAEAVASAAGTDLPHLASLSRGEAVSKMQAGVASVAMRLLAEKRVHGALCVAGAGAHLVGPAFQGLPFGFPKLIITPLASGTRIFEPFVGVRDVAIMHSVADVAGVNALTEKVYAQAAGYIVGAARATEMLIDGDRESSHRPMIAASMNGNTTPAVTRARELLTDYEVLAFHANGVGGRAMEDLITAQFFDAVLDYTTTELCGHEVGGLMDPGEHRMEAAGRLGLPQVLVPGCIDFITTGRYEDTEREFPGRALYRHSPELTLVRLTTDEMGRLGQIFASKASRALGPTTVCVPARGFSVPDIEGGPFWNPEADGEFIAALKDQLSDRVRLEIVDAHVNDHAFVDVAVGALRSMTGRRATAETTGGSLANAR